MVEPAVGAGGKHQRQKQRRHGHVGDQQTDLNGEDENIHAGLQVFSTR